MFIVKSLICFLDSTRALELLGYIDPGTGSLVFQAIAASLISGALFVRGAAIESFGCSRVALRVKSQPDVTPWLADDDDDLNVEVPIEVPRNAA